MVDDATAALAALPRKLKFPIIYQSILCPCHRLTDINAKHAKNSSESSNKNLTAQPKIPIQWSDSHIWGNRLPRMHQNRINLFCALRLPLLGVHKKAKSCLMTINYIKCFRIVLDDEMKVGRR